MNDIVDNLFKRPKLSQSDFMNLRNKYGDEEFVDKLQKLYIYEDTRITKKAKKLIHALKKKYPNYKQLPYHYLLEITSKCKKKYSLSDAMYIRFKELVEQELIDNKSQEVLIPSTKMMKVLGFLDLNYTMNTNKNLSDLDAKCIQEIMKINANPIFLDKQRQVILQSYIFDCKTILNGTYRPELGDSNMGPLVHPVIAALFGHKFDVLDYHFLFSNIANIVDSRYNNKNLQFISDIKLFNALVRDPNDILCNSTSPYADLLSRVRIQHCLWDTVLHFRQGKFYRSPCLSMLIQELSSCNLLSINEQSLMFGNTDGVILKRLLNAFSFRPTIIYHMPTNNNIKVLFTTNPFQSVVRPIVTNTSLIYLKPPLSFDTNKQVIKISDAFRQYQPVYNFNEPPQFRETIITYSNGVIFFYVDRRQTKMFDQALFGTTFSNVNLRFGKGIPYSVINTYDRLNQNIQVIAPNVLPINNHTYNLKSVVLANTIDVNKHKIITNSSTLLFYDKKVNIGPPTCYRYDPIGLNIDRNIINPVPIDIISKIPTNKTLSSGEYINTYGLIYIYELV